MDQTDFRGVIVIGNPYHDWSAFDSPRDSTSTATTDKDETHELVDVKADVKTKEDASTEKSKPPPPVGFRALFRFATTTDVVINYIGVVCAVASGAAQPLMSLIFGNLTTSFVTFAKAIALGESTTGAADSFKTSANRDALYLVIIGIGQFVMTTTYMYIWTYTGEVNAKRVRERYLQAVLRQDIAYFDKVGAGEVATRIQTDTHLVQQGTSEKVALTCSHLGTFFCGFILAYVRSWRLALALSSILPCMMVTGAFTTIFISKYTQMALNHIADGGSLAEEILGTIRTAQAFGNQNKLSDLYNVHVDRAYLCDTKRAIYNGVGVGILFFVVYSAYGLAFSFGTTLVLRNEATVGIVVNVFLALLTGSFSLASLAPELAAISSGRAAAAKLYATIDRVPHIDSYSDEGQTLPTVKGRIIVENAYFSYPSRKNVQVLKGASLVFPAGKTCALVGASGSGKSTIVSLVERFYDPTAGIVMLDGVDVRDLNVRWLRSQIGLVSQEPTLFATSIRDNVGHGLINTIWEHASETEKTKLIKAACFKANADTFIMNLPEGYDTLVGERGFLLSGGQKQRIAIARAIVSDPKILLLDEATSALDTQSEGIVQDALNKASAGRTTISIAHRLSTVKSADIIYVMGDGQVLESGTHGHLLRNANGPYKRLVDSQKLREQDNANEEDDDFVDYGSDSDDSSITSEPEVKLSRRSTIRKSLMDAKSMIDNLIDGKSILGGTSTRSYSIRRENSKHRSMHRETVLRRESVRRPAPVRRKSTRRSMASMDQLRPRRRKEPDPMARYDVEDYDMLYLFKRMGQINSDQWRYYLLGAAFAVCNGMVYPAFGVVFGHAVSGFTQTGSALRREGDQNALWFFVIALLATVVVVGQNYCFSHSAATLTRKLRAQYFKAMLRQDIDYFDLERNSTGALTSNLSENPQKVSGLAGMTLGAILQSMSTLVGGSVIGIAFAWKLALVGVACIPFVVSAGYVRLRVVVLKDQKNKKEHEASAQLACEAAGAIRTVASLTRERDCCDVYSKSLEEPLRLSNETSIRSTALFALSQSMSFWVIALVFWYGSRLVVELEINIFHFFVVLMSTTYGAIQAGNVFAFVPDISAAKGSASAMVSLLDCHPTVDADSFLGEKLPAVEGHLKFEDLHFEYPTRRGQPVLRGLDIEVQPGTYIALVGASGCGKSTVIQLVERFYNPSSGKVLMDGLNITSLNVQEYRKRIALVSQEPTLYSGTIRFNILLGAAKPVEEITQEEIEAACRDANILEFIQDLPDGFDTEVGGKGSQLSGGQKQRIAIARALLRNPRILLLDEATSALDSNSEKIVQEALDRAARGRTTIAIAHRLSTIQNADCIYFLKEGRVAESGSHNELLARKGDYYEYVQLQALSKS